MTLVRRGLRAGLMAGLVLVGAMELASWAGMAQSLPDSVQSAVLGMMPGAVFGFLIDTLQHAGKVIEEASLLAVMVALLAALGVAAAAAGDRGLPRPGLVSAALLWALICLVALPASNAGWLGLSQGLTTPLVWAVLCILYGIVLDAGLSAGQPGFDPGRRRLLGWAGFAGLIAIGLAKVPGWLQVLVSPPERSSGLTPALTPPGNFYVVSKNFQDPVVDVKTWQLEVGGLAGSPYRLTYDQLTHLSAQTITVTMECVSNLVGGSLISTGRFTGVPLGELLDRARPQSRAGAVSFRSRDGFTESLSMALAMSDPQIMVVSQLDGQPLPNAHGFPARVLIPGRYGMRSPKWLDSISLTPSEDGGYWESQGWNHDAVIKTTTRIDVPASGALLSRGHIEVGGVAFAGDRGIRLVEWSADGGRTWQPAQLEPPLSRLTWVRWTASWIPSGAGSYTLVARARDGQGQLQTQTESSSFPDGASGWDRVAVQVG